MRPELIIHLTNAVELCSPSREFRAGDSVQIRLHEETKWKRTIHEIEKDPTQFMLEFAEALMEYAPSLCRQSENSTTIELNTAWLAISAAEVGIYNSPTEAASFGDQDGRGQFAYWKADQIIENPRLIIVKIFEAIAQQQKTDPD